MNGDIFDNVFDALGYAPAQVASLTARAERMMRIRERVRSWDGSLEHAASRLGLTRPRLDDLMRAKVDTFSLDTLASIAARAGLVADDPA